MKRIFDVLFSGIILILISPLFIPLMILLRLTGEGKIFYIQPRVGKNQQLFGLYKFATMLENSPNLSGGDITTKNDPRVLPVGRFLRKSKLNELPQLLNIFLGHMSVIGPRPLTPKTFSYYPVSFQETISKVAPGLSGIGSIIFRDEERHFQKSEMDHHAFYQQEIAPFKGELEKWYTEHVSFLLDLKLILLTAIVILHSNSTAPTTWFPNLPKHPIFLP